MSEDGIVRKHNDMITKQVYENMTIRELKMVASAAARIDPNDQEFKTYSIHVTELVSPEAKTRDVYRTIYELTDKILKRVVRMEEKTKDGKLKITKYGLFSKCQYVEGTGYVDVQFHPDLKPYFLMIKGDYTKYQLKFLRRLQSAHSYKLYELFKSLYQYNITEKEYPLEELHKKLGITENRGKCYLVWPTFREKILLKARKDMERATDITFEFFPRRKDKSRKTSHVLFRIQKNPYFIATSDEEAEIDPSSVIIEAECESSSYRESGINQKLYTWLNESMKMEESRAEELAAKFKDMPEELQKTVYDRVVAKSKKEHIKNFASYFYKSAVNHYNQINKENTSDEDDGSANTLAKIQAQKAKETRKKLKGHD